MNAASRVSLTFNGKLGSRFPIHHLEQHDLGRIFVRPTTSDKPLAIVNNIAATLDPASLPATTRPWRVTLIMDPSWPFFSPMELRLMSRIPGVRSALLCDPPFPYDEGKVGPFRSAEGLLTHDASPLVPMGITQCGIVAYPNAPDPDAEAARVAHLCHLAHQRGMTPFISVDWALEATAVNRLCAALNARGLVPLTPSDPGLDTYFNVQGPLPLRDIAALSRLERRSISSSNMLRLARESLPFLGARLQDTALPRAAIGAHAAVGEPSVHAPRGAAGPYDAAHAGDAVGAMSQWARAAPHVCVGNAAAVAVPRSPSRRRAYSARGVLSDDEVDTDDVRAARYDGRMDVQPHSATGGAGRSTHFPLTTTGTTADELSYDTTGELRARFVSRTRRRHIDWQTTRHRDYDRSPEEWQRPKWDGPVNTGADPHQHVDYDVHPYGEFASSDRATTLPAVLGVFDPANPRHHIHVSAAFRDVSETANGAHAYAAVAFGHRFLDLIGAAPASAPPRDVEDALDDLPFVAPRDRIERMYVSPYAAPLPRVAGAGAESAHDVPRCGVAGVGEDATRALSAVTDAVVDVVVREDEALRARPRMFAFQVAARGAQRDTSQVELPAGLGVSEATDASAAGVSVDDHAVHEAEMVYASRGTAQGSADTRTRAAAVRWAQDEDGPQNDRLPRRGWRGDADSPP